MKSIKLLFIIILFYFLVLLQATFLVHFNIFGITFNLVLVLTIIWNIFEESKNPFGVFLAGINGLFLDIFSSGLIGFNILILIGG